MVVKLSLTFVALAALVPSTLGRLQCAMQTNKANIEFLEVHSNPDLVEPAQYAGPWDQASVTLTSQHYVDIEEAGHYIKMRHWGKGCLDTDAKDEGPICKGKQNTAKHPVSCAQVSQMGEMPSRPHGVSIDVGKEEHRAPVKYRAYLAPSLRQWKIGVADSCAQTTFPANDDGMKVLTFNAFVPHVWSKATVKLDREDYGFGKSWLCAYDDQTTYEHPQVNTEDGITFEIINPGFTAKHPGLHYHAW